jgi:hypothetical protein
MAQTATVTLSWTPSPAAEQVTKYNVYGDGGLLGSPTSPDFVINLVTPGVHSFTVAPVNVWGEGPMSDPVLTPPACSNITNVAISITVQVS